MNLKHECEAIAYCISVAAVMATIVTTPAPVQAQAVSIASIRETMADRAQLCAAALIVEGTKRGERAGAALREAGAPYTSLAMMMAEPGRVTPESIVRSLDRKGMSRSRVRDIAVFCKEQLDYNRLQFSLDAVPGFPANDLVRAQLCSSALDAAATMLNPATEKQLAREIEQARGKLNLFYIVRRRAMGMPDQKDHGKREAFRSPSSGSARPTPEEVAGCVVAGRQALVTIAELR